MKEQSKDTRDATYVHARNSHGLKTWCNRPTNTVKYKCSLAEFRNLSTPPAPWCPKCYEKITSMRLYVQIYLSRESQGENKDANAMTDLKHYLASAGWSVNVTEEYTE